MFFGVSGGAFASATSSAHGAAVWVGGRASSSTIRARASRNPDAQASSLAVSRLMLSAESSLEQDEPQDSLRVLNKLRKEAGLHTAALRLELRALQAARRWTDIPPLLDQLVRRKVFDAAQAEHVRISAQSEQLKFLAHDAAGLRDYWSRLADATKPESYLTARSRQRANRSPH